MVKKHSNSVASTSERVAKQSKIEDKTLAELIELLEETGHNFHIAIEIETEDFLKTLDNEQDAKQMIFNLKRKLEKAENE